MTAAATFNLGDLSNQVDNVLRFEKGKERDDKSRPQTVVSEDHLGAPPAFCNKLDCPEFKVVGHGTGYDIREYKASRWVSTTSIGIDYETSQHDDFMRLFNYISGKNEKKQKIAMTAPVINRIVPGQGPACANNFTMSFFIAPKEGQPPSPSDDKVFLSRLPVFRAYVRSFTGFANKDKFLSEALELTDTLRNGSISYVEEYFYTAGYDSPFKLFNRHNEIWFIAK
ncbi:hypothetical protein V1264_020182 [Littorina saxatilis]